jgi:aspartyl-tRNA(Asn)/glutamyl-tRNA(Gln) amidotransferase subunit C
MSSLSRDDVAKLAGLARIEMTESELVELSSQFGMILDAVARVQEMDLSSLSPEDALSGAPAKEESRFRVPQILGEAE